MITTVHKIRYRVRKAVCGAGIWPEVSYLEGTTDDSLVTCEKCVVDVVLKRLNVPKRLGLEELAKLVHGA